MSSDSKMVHNPRAAADAMLRRSAKPVPDAAEPREAFDDARPRSREDIMLDVRLKDGTREAFNYAYLVKVTFTPGDTLLLRFGTDEVKVQGRRLAPLYERLTEHRARFIQEGTETEEGLKSEDAAHIDAIELSERNDEE